MYEDIVQQTVYQGDIVRGFVFSNIDQPASIPLDDGRLADSFTIRPRLDYRQAIIVTQTCDITRREFILLAPIFQLQTFIDTHKRAGKKEDNIRGEVSQLKSQKLFYYFYIPPDVTRSVEEGYADLTFLNPFERIRIASLERTARLNDYQRHVLAYKLGNLFLRPH